MKTTTKTIITMILAGVLVLFNTIASANDGGQFKIKGKVLNEDYCNIVIMYTNDAGEWVKYDMNTRANRFKLKLVDGKSYKIIFEGETKTKVLDIPPTKKRERFKLIIDVDFKTEHNCQVVRTKTGFRIVKTKEVIC
jgi:hypothetical protein